MGSFKKTNANDRRSWKITGDRIFDVPLSKIKADPSQPRKNFDQESLKSLAASIKREGILSPVELREDDGTLTLVVGERRCRAAKLAGLKSVPAFIKPTGDELDRKVRQLVENIQREDLSVLDQAQAFQALIDAGQTQAQVAKAVGKDRTTVSKALLCGRFFESLPEDLKAKCERVHIPFRIFSQIATQKPHQKALKALSGLFDESPEKGKKKPQVAGKDVSAPTTRQFNKALKDVDSKDLCRIIFETLPPGSVAKLYKALQG